MHSFVYFLWISWWLSNKASVCSVRDTRDVGLIPGGGYGNPPQYTCLGNPIEKEDLWARVHRVEKSWKWLKQLRKHAHRFSIFWICQYFYSFIYFFVNTFKFDIVLYSFDEFSLVAQQVKNPLAMQETQFDSWVGKIPWRREQLCTPVFWPGELHGKRSLAGYSPWGHKELDTTERLSLSFTFNEFSPNSSGGFTYTLFTFLLRHTKEIFLSCYLF